MWIAISRFQGPIWSAPRPTLPVAVSDAQCAGNSSSMHNVSDSVGTFVTHIVWRRCTISQYREVRYALIPRHCLSYCLPRSVAGPGPFSRRCLVLLRHFVTLSLVLLVRRVFLSLFGYPARYLHSYSTPTAHGVLDSRAMCASLLALESSFVFNLGP